MLKDRGSRTFPVVRRPEYALIHMLTRYPERFEGFEVRESSERRLLTDARGVPFAGGLIGNVRTQGIREVMSQREIAHDLAGLLRRGRRDEEQTERLLLLVRQVSRVDEFYGSEGIEGHFDRHLTGRNGYRELRGLQEIQSGEGVAAVDLPPEDGDPLVLTLDLDLQRAAMECLERPAEDPDPSARDYNWLSRPTGAIVLIRPDGDVLVAASFPDRDRGTAVRDSALERTLRRPGFQPPGSVFKPFVAAWALDNVGFDPGEAVDCTLLLSGRGCGYLDLACWKEWGHGLVDLHDALKHSCNGYFAWLGDRYTTPGLRPCPRVRLRSADRCAQRRGSRRIARGHQPQPVRARAQGPRLPPGGQRPRSGRGDPDAGGAGLRGAGHR